MKADIVKQITLHGLNSLLPLVIVPLFIQRLGVAQYGEISVAIAVNQYVLLCVEYGFTLGAAKSAAELRGRASSINQLFSEVQAAKMLILMAAAFVMTGGFLLREASSERLVLIIIGLIIPVSNIVTAQWLFMGMDHMKTLMLYTVYPRLASIPLIYWLVESPSDINIAIGLQLAPQFLTALMAAAHVHRRQWARWETPSASGIWRRCSENFQLFKSGLASNLYSSSTALLLDIFSTTENVGIFSAADKFRQAAQSLITPITQIVFPKITSALQVDQNRAWHTIRSSSILVLVANFTSAVALFASATWISAIAFSSSAEPTGAVMRALSPAVLLIGLNAIVCTHVIIPLGYFRALSRNSAIALLIHVSLMPFAANAWGALGATLSITVTEFSIFALSVIVLRYIEVESPTAGHRTSALRRLISLKY